MEVEGGVEGEVVVVVYFAGSGSYICSVMVVVAVAVVQWQLYFHVWWYLSS